jgi:hypothetical protein
MLSRLVEDCVLEVTRYLSPVGRLIFSYTCKNNLRFLPAQKLPMLHVLHEVISGSSLSLYQYFDQARLQYIWQAILAEHLSLRAIGETVTSKAFRWLIGRYQILLTEHAWELLLEFALLVRTPEDLALLRGSQSVGASYHSWLRRIEIDPSFPSELVASWFNIRKTGLGLESLLIGWQGRHCGKYPMTSSVPAIALASIALHDCTVYHQMPRFWDAFKHWESRLCFLDKLSLVRMAANLGNTEVLSHLLRANNRLYLSCGWNRFNLTTEMLNVIRDTDRLLPLSRDLQHWNEPLYSEQEANVLRQLAAMGCRISERLWIALYGKEIVRCIDARFKSRLVKNITVACAVRSFMRDLKSQNRDYFDFECDVLGDFLQATISATDQVDLVRRTLRSALNTINSRKISESYVNKVVRYVSAIAKVTVLSSGTIPLFIARSKRVPLLLREAVTRSGLVNNKMNKNRSSVVR